MSRRSRAAVARSSGGDRTMTILIGLVLLAASVLTLLVSFGVLGEFRAQRSLVDPLALDWINANLTAARWIAVGVGVGALLLGLIWAARSLRPEHKPDVELSGTAGQRLTVEHSAVCEAVRRDADSIPGVSRARVKLVGDRQHPALRMSLSLHEGTDVQDVWADIDGRVLARARQAFGVSELPTAVRLELESARTSTARVQ